MIPLFSFSFVALQNFGDYFAVRNLAVKQSGFRFLISLIHQILLLLSR